MSVEKQDDSLEQVQDDVYLGVVAGGLARQRMTRFERLAEHKRALVELGTTAVFAAGVGAAVLYFNRGEAEPTAA